MQTCDACGRNIAQGEDCGDMTTGWLKRDDAEDPDYDPSGDEWLLCDACTKLVVETINIVKKIKRTA